jgi:hypothetical protein
VGGITTAGIVRTGGVTMGVGGEDEEGEAEERVVGLTRVVDDDEVEVEGLPQIDEVLCCKAILDESSACAPPPTTVDDDKGDEDDEKMEDNDVDGTGSGVSVPGAVTRLTMSRRDG